jgi:hypothetical protein
MELDDLKQALNRLDKRLEDQKAVNPALVRRDTRNRAEDRLRPLARAQVRLIVAGAVTALIGIAAWHGTRGDPGGPFVSGIVLHVYGVAMILFGAITRGLISAIDWAGPVVAIQQRLARVRKAHVLAGMTIGLSWCAMWVPAMIVLFHLSFGIDVTAASPATWLWMTAGGIAMMAAVWMLYRWARATGRTSVVAAFDSAFTGADLRRARADLDALARFERD